MHKINLSFVVNTTDPDAAVGFEAWLDTEKFFDSDHIRGPITVTHEIEDDDGEHQLTWVLKNKTNEHTRVSDTGEIVKDVLISLGEITVDDINIDSIVQNLSQYYHNFNGSADETQDEFYGNLGCNGRLVLEFKTPFYLWLLDNM